MADVSGQELHFTISITLRLKFGESRREVCFHLCRVVRYGEADHGETFCYRQNILCPEGQQDNCD